MDTEDIYRLALGIFNISYQQVGADSMEAMLCADYLEAAKEVCLTTNPWPFLLRTASFGDADRIEGSHRGLGYGYAMPDDLAYPYLINGKYDETFSISGGNIYFPFENPEVEYVSDSVDIGDMPSLYVYLIADELAIQIAPMLASDSTKVEAKAASLFQRHLASLNLMYQNTSRQKNPNKDWFVI